MKKIEIETRVLSVLKTILGVDLNSKSLIEEIDEWDSLKHIDVIFSLEDEFDIRFEEDIINDIVGIVSLVDSIHILLNKK